MKRILLTTLLFLGTSSQHMNEILYTPNHFEHLNKDGWIFIKIIPRVEELKRQK